MPRCAVCEGQQCAQARVEELLREQSQPETIQLEVKQQLAVAQLQAEMSEMRSALAQVLGLQWVSQSSLFLSHMRAAT